MMDLYKTIDELQDELTKHKTALALADEMANAASALFLVNPLGISKVADSLLEKLVAFDNHCSETKILDYEKDDES